MKKIIERWRQKRIKLKETFIFRNRDRKETFTFIYQNKIWGAGKEEQQEYYSGPGSHDKKYVEPYCDMVKNFISQNNISTVVDIGCGDFNVASKWLNENITYIGVDIVQGLIDHHIERYGTDNIHFQCIDVVDEDLPDAELCLVRQVLQHLSNKEVSLILNKLKKYKYVIITEHITQKESASKYNIDKTHGNHIRVNNQSGLYLDEAPFNLNVKTLLEISFDGTEEVLTSVLLI